MTDPTVADIIIEGAKADRRDRFAAAALTGILASQPREDVQNVADGIKGGMIEAKAAYGWADAMMAARDGKAR